MCLISKNYLKSERGSCVKELPRLLYYCSEYTDHTFIINWWMSYNSCHEWVTDGYTQNMWTTCETTGPSAGRPTYNYGFLYLHMNWGWHEIGSSVDYNGWYMNQSWNIPGANLNFQYSVGATTNIHL